MQSQWFFTLRNPWSSEDIRRGPWRLLQSVKGPNRQVFNQSALFYLIYVLVLDTLCLNRLLFGYNNWIEIESNNLTKSYSVEAEPGLNLSHFILSLKSFQWLSVNFKIKYILLAMVFTFLLIWLLSISLAYFLLCSLLNALKILHRHCFISGNCPNNLEIFIMLRFFTSYFFDHHSEDYEPSSIFP